VSSQDITNNVDNALETNDGYLGIKSPFNQQNGNTEM
jgi:hypothetical protein